MNLVRDLDEHMKACNPVEIYAIITKSLKQSLRVMQNDYEFDYYEYEYTSDFNESYDTSDLEEDYARDGQDYESLAYRHYA